MSQLWCDNNPDFFCHFPAAVLHIHVDKHEARADEEEQEGGRDSFSVEKMLQSFTLEEDLQ